MQRVASKTINMIWPFQPMCNRKDVILKLYILLEAFDYKATVFPCQTRVIVFTIGQ